MKEHNPGINYRNTQQIVYNPFILSILKTFSVQFLINFITLQILLNNNVGN